jgi:hypothetical protein
MAELKCVKKVDFGSLVCYLAGVPGAGLPLAGPVKKNLAKAKYGETS